MPEVQNVGAVDYAQYQPSQSQYQYENYDENYNMQPQVYDEEAAEVRAASKSRLGATLLTAAVIGGLALWGGHAWGKKSAAKEVEKLKDTIDQFQDAAGKYKEFLDKTAPELEKEATEVRNSNIFYWKRGGRFADRVKEEIAKLRQTFESTKDEAAENVEKAADDINK